MTRTVKAKFDGKVLIPSSPVDLPVGKELVLTITESDNQYTPKSPLQKLAEIAAQYPPLEDGLTDGAAQHDHYLYGTPKRKSLISSELQRGQFVVAKYVGH